MEADPVLESCWEIREVFAEPFDFDRRVPRPSSRQPSTRLSTPSPARRPTGRPVVARRRTSCGDTLRGAGAATRKYLSTLVADLRLDQLAILRLEVDHPSSGDEAAVRGRKPHDVGHLVGPCERKRCPAGKPPPALLKWGPAPVDLPAMGRGRPGDTRVSRRGEPLRPVFSHMRIYA